MLKRILCLLLISATAISAADTVPSEASIRELLTVTDSKKMVDGMMGQMNMMMQNSIREATKGREVSATEQKIVDKTTADMQTTMADVLAWGKLEPLYIRVYQRSLTQAEVDGMIAFYKTPVGQAMIHKMPVIIQNTMTEVQGMMAPVMQKMQQSQQALISEMEAERKKAKK